MNTLTTEQIREIIDGAPDGAFAIDHLIGSKEPCYLCIRDEGIVAVHIGQVIGFAPNEYPFSIRYQSLSDLREILELRERVETLERKSQDGFAIGETVAVFDKRVEDCPSIMVEVLGFGDDVYLFYDPADDVEFAVHACHIDIPQPPKENTND